MVFNRILRNADIVFRFGSGFVANNDFWVSAADFIRIGMIAGIAVAILQRTLGTVIMIAGISDVIFQT